MTRDERRALREKHEKKLRGVFCVYCYDDFPCDTIRVLDYVDLVEPS